MNKLLTFVLFITGAATIITLQSKADRYGSQSGKYTQSTLALSPQTIPTDVQTMAKPIITQVIGDIEGNWDRLLSQANSPESVLIIDQNGCGSLKKHGRIRFLGDITDKGPNNCQVLTFILNLKRKYPKQVELIIGNRDLNKLRFNWELTRSALDLRGEDTRDEAFRIYEWKTKWDKWIADGKNKIDGVIVAYTHGEHPTTDGILKMKWMLSETMGAPDLFESVKKELNLATDVLTYCELRAWARSGGLWTQYLKLASIIHYDKNSDGAPFNADALYMHGGVSDTNFGIVPGDQKKYENIEQWVAALNAWGVFVIDAGIRGKMNNALAGAQYQEPEVITDDNGKTKWGAPNPISVIHGRPWSADYNIKPIDNETAEKLEEQRVRFVFSGHSPIGQIAVIIRAPNNVLSILCDTSATQKPPRGSIIVLRDNVVTIYSDLYDADNKKYAIISSNADPRVGVQTNGILTITDTVSASWTRAKSGAAFGDPTYIFSEITAE